MDVTKVWAFSSLFIHNIPPNMNVITLRSSINSVSVVYAADNPDNLREFANDISVIGIDHSPGEKFFFKEEFCEYTSWYQRPVFSEVKQRIKKSKFVRYPLKYNVQRPSFLSLFEFVLLPLIEKFLFHNIVWSDPLRLQEQNPPDDYQSVAKTASAIPEI